MKKGLLIALLVVAILTSVITGTLAVYNTSLDELNGNVVSKAFIFEAADLEGENYIGQLKIAPTETENFTFSLQNYSGNPDNGNAIVSEVPMKITVNVRIVPKTDNDEIIPLQYKLILLDNNGETKDSVTFDSNESSELIYYLPLKSEGVKKQFRIEVTWTETDNDTHYQNMENLVKVSVNALQINESDIPNKPSGDDDDDDDNQYIEVTYFKLNNFDFIDNISDCKFVTREQFEAKYPEETFSDDEIEAQNAIRYYFAFVNINNRISDITSQGNDNMGYVYLSNNHYNPDNPYPVYTFSDNEYYYRLNSIKELIFSEQQAYNYIYENEYLNLQNYYFTRNVQETIIANATYLASYGLNYSLLNNYTNFVNEDRTFNMEYYYNNYLSNSNEIYNNERKLLSKNSIAENYSTTNNHVQISHWNYNYLQFNNHWYLFSEKSNGKYKLYRFH